MTYAIELNGLDARIFIDPTVQGARAHGLLFDEDANVITSTDGKQYIDYCHWEIAYLIACKLFDHRRQTEPEDIAHALDAICAPCECV